MRKKSFILLASMGIIVMSCNQAPQTTTTDMPATEATVVTINTDSIVAAIDSYRNSVEQEVSEGVEVKTDSLRAKIKQKWQKIHFYSQDESVVRIKTYPYAEISARTEEFYFQNGELVLAVIEDDGAGERGKTAEQIDKMYYFHKGEVIKEAHGNSEAEYGIKHSDGEELLSEAKEYLEIFAKQ